MTFEFKFCLVLYRAGFGSVRILGQFLLSDSGCLFGKMAVDAVVSCNPLCFLVSKFGKKLLSNR